MKKIVSLLFLTALLLTACTGDQGPMGPPGVPGNTGNPGSDGKVIASSAFEISVNFNANKNFSHEENYGFKVLESDVTLVYILWKTKDDKDIYRLLPQSVTFDDGTDLLYNFEFTQTYVRFFLDGNTDFTNLGNQWTQNQVFRVVVVPANNIDGVDVSNLNEVIQATNIESFDIK